ncbi:gamma-glutamylcyclotransferase family protein [Marinimicrobium alkaliphilum]|uniref:gamma-glutamylcyclotransferase family protein n=1 Tax=Marinimicrobium alkaliphilum TaxID=2202654 RepID=UPI0018E083EA|nr:gamma-glutamylcyclotransferase family protein [Marinimicrobium alkaliphilum]
MRLSKRLTVSLVILSLALILAGNWWRVFMSPWGFDHPEDFIPVQSDEPHKVFVYGTLTWAPVRWLVTGRAGSAEPAVLDNYRRDGLDLTPEPGAKVEGYILRVSSRELLRLDRYERLGIRYSREPVSLRDHSLAWVYRRLDPDLESASD